VVRVPSWSVASRKLAAQYGVLARDHFAPLAAVQSGILRGGADVAGQMMQHGLRSDHAFAMALMGGVVSGWGNAKWLQVLEGRYGEGTTSDVVLRKTVTDYLCWAPLANSAYLIGLPLLTGQGMDVAVETWHTGFLSVMLLELSIFAPYNLLAFNQIPQSLRPLSSAVLAAVFTIGLGMLA